MSTEYSLSTGAAQDLPSTAFEHAYREGWTDGLPIIPADAATVAAFVRASGRDAGEVLGAFPPRHGRVTIEVVAVNAVMAGCRPDYMPAVVAAVECLLDPQFPLHHMQVTTNSEAPFVLFNGPVRKTLDINCEIGCLGPGWRANATIGRTLRLMMYTCGGGLPGIYSRSSFASPLRYTFVCGENEEANPWNPYHVDAGFGRDESTVTVFAASSYCLVNGSFSANGDEILRHIASQMPPCGPTDKVLLMLGPNNARTLAADGLTKADVQRRLWECARLPQSSFPPAFVEALRDTGRADERTLWRCQKPEDFVVVTAGGPGPYDVYISAKSPCTKRIREARP